jgi:hypothetical protein
MKQQQFPALSSPDEDLTVSFTRRELRAMRDAQIEVLNVSSLLGFAISPACCPHVPSERNPQSLSMAP